MIHVEGKSIEPGVSVVAWLEDALQRPPPNPSEQSPAERLHPALAAASQADRDTSVLALAHALGRADDTLRQHIMYALKRFSSDDLHDLTLIHI